MKKKDKEEIDVKVCIVIATTILFILALWRDQTTKLGDLIITVVLGYNLVIFNKNFRR